jgi:hypothetical protein
MITIGSDLFSPYPALPCYAAGMDAGISTGVTHMAAQATMESIKAEGGQLIEQVKQLIHEGNVRRVVIKQGEETVAEFPLTVGVVGAVLAPVLAAIGALVALLSDCTIEVERVVDDLAPQTAAPMAEGNTEL